MLSLNAVVHFFIATKSTKALKLDYFSFVSPPFLVCLSLLCFLSSIDVCVVAVRASQTLNQKIETDLWLMNRQSLVVVLKKHVLKSTYSSRCQMKKRENIKTPGPPEWFWALWAYIFYFSRCIEYMCSKRSMLLFGKLCILLGDEQREKKHLMSHLLTDI